MDKIKSAFEPSKMLVAYVMLALVIGGTSFDNLWHSILLQTATTLLALYIFSQPRLYQHGFLSVFGIPLLLILVVVLQLLPLPVDMIKPFVGDLRAHAVRQAIGYDGPISISVDWNATANFLIFLIMGIASYQAFRITSTENKSYAIATIVLVALVSLFVAGIQFASKGALLNFYDSPHAPKAIGFFSNRNHQALLLAIAAAGANYFIWTRLPQKAVRLWLSAFFSLAFLVAVIATASRAGLVLCGSSILISLLFFGPPIDRKSIQTIWGPIALVGIVAVFLFSQNTVSQDTADRFATVSDDLRWEIWRLSLAAALEHLPFGTGLGTFETAYRVHQPLEFVREQYVNRAHNDYIELFLEIGVLAPILIFLLLFGAGRKLLQLKKYPKESTDQIKLGFLWLMLIMAHSIVDYPLRTPAIMIVFSISLALLYGQSQKTGPDVSQKPSQ